MRRALLAAGLGLAMALGGNALAQSPPMVTLGKPIVVPAHDNLFPSTPIQSVSYQGPGGSIQLTQGVDPIAPPPPTPVGPGGGGAMPFTPQERYNSGVIMEPPPVGGGPAPAGGKPWYGFVPGFENGWQGTRHHFQSDHCFDNFISPVTNPFFFEDPRALTEIRPIFIWQRTPKDNYVYGKSDIYWAGLQARLALCENFSIVMNKLGWISQDPQNPFAAFPDVFDKSSGFAELQIGPKWTFLRREDSGTLGAVGLTFDIPVGSGKVFQDTGHLSLVPYFSFGQNFLRSSYGSFNALVTPGYSFRTDNVRTDYFFLSLHVDFDIANAHRFYPFLEMNWTNFTRAGKATDLGFEGRDLYNFGSTGVSGNNNLTLAPGFRFKFNECIQTGLAAEFPIVGRHDLLEFRLTADLIFRY